MHTLNDIPGPARHWWGLPHLSAMKRDYLGFITSLHQQYGDLARLGILKERSVDLFHPDALREAMVDNADALIRWERGTQVFGELMGQNVLVTEGAVWQRQRRMLMQAFTPKRVAGYSALMVDAARTGLDAALPAGQVQATVVMDTLFSHLTMDVILRTLFGRPAGPDAAATAQAAQAVQDLSAAAFSDMFLPFTLPDWLPLRGKATKRRALRHMRGLIQGCMDEHAAAPAHPPRGNTTLLAMLRELRDDDSDSGNSGHHGGSALSEQEVFDQCMVSFQAGHETSATALLWWSWLLATHPDAVDRAQAEVDTVLAGRAPGPDDVARLPWLGATLKEAMRLFPPIGALLARRCTRAITVAGHTLPARTMLRITPWVLHRDARWFPEPERFDPRRFMPDAAPPPRGAYIPFGLGPRVCLGQHFAVLEMTLIAALLLQRYRLQPVPGEAAPQPLMHVTLRPQQPLRLLLQRR